MRTKPIFSLKPESLRHGRSNYQHLDNLATDSVWIETDLVEPATIGAANTPTPLYAVRGKLNTVVVETLAGKAGA
jgi:hypothetical protein